MRTVRPRVTARRAPSAALFSARSRTPGVSAPSRSTRVRRHECLAAPYDADVARFVVAFEQRSRSRFLAFAAVSPGRRRRQMAALRGRVLLRRDDHDREAQAHAARLMGSLRSAESELEAASGGDAVHAEKARRTSRRTPPARGTGALAASVVKKVADGNPNRPGSNRAGGKAKASAARGGTSITKKKKSAERPPRARLARESASPRRRERFGARATFNNSLCQ